MNIEVKDLIIVNEDDINALQKEKCDKYDYLTAVACGAIGGLVDIFLVGAPGDSVLGKWTDKQVDNAVISFAKRLGWKAKKGKGETVNSAIGFLEGNTKGFDGFRVNYDQRKPSDVNNQFNIAPKTHHLMSLGHSPDIIGLFFSILNQFTSTSSFISNGQLITINTEKFELEGGDFLSKLFCGVANWFGHLMSDVAGSSGSHGRGSGIAMPFYELFGFCKFGSFSTGDGKKDLAELAVQAFNQGYDFRFGLAQAIPVAITEMSIRLIWALRQRFQFNKPIKECFPSLKHDSLRTMILLGNGTLCVLDLTDAAIRSGGNALTAFLRLNLVGWTRLTMLVFKEVFIRLGVAADIDLHLESYTRINDALSEYMLELKTLDIELFEKETQRYNVLVSKLDSISSEKELSSFLAETYKDLGIELPWQGEFDEFMSDNNQRLVFK